jgi:hypothetical protein
LCDRFPRNEIPAALRTVSKKHPTAVVLLDLGSEQLAESAAAPVSTVLYWKVLQWAGFSKEKKTAQLEFTLDRCGKVRRVQRKIPSALQRRMGGNPQRPADRRRPRGGNRARSPSR